MLNLVFLFVFAGQAVADRCTTGDSAYKLKATLTNLYCNNADYTCTAGNCDCGSACCEPKPDTCLALQTAGSTCTSPKVVDDATKATSATTANYGTTCCKTTTTTTTTACTDCCFSLMAGGTFCPSATHVTKSSAIFSAATAANFQATCCVAKKKCDFQCPTNTNQISAYSTTDCAAETCTQNECCVNDPAKCLGVSASCTGNNFRDAAKAGAAADSNNFQSNCCTAKGTCSGFQAYTPPAGTASSAEHLKPIMAPLFAALAVMAV